MELIYTFENPTQREILHLISSEVPRQIKWGLVGLSFRGYDLFKARENGKGLWTYRFDRNSDDYAKTEPEITLASKNPRKKPAGLCFKFDGEIDFPKFRMQVLNEKLVQGYVVNGAEFLWNLKGENNRKFMLFRYDSVAIKGIKTLEVSVCEEERGGKEDKEKREEKS